MAANYTDAQFVPSDVSDARAIWVNPAGLGARPTASIYIDLVSSDPGEGGRLSQISGAIEARGFGFGYQRDMFDTGTRGDTYRVTLGAGSHSLAAGMGASLYRGGAKATAWDVGVVYDTKVVNIAGTVRNIGQPVVRGVALRATAIPAITVHTARNALELSAAGRFTTDSALGYTAGLRLTVSRPIGWSLLTRIELDRTLHRSAVTLGFAIGASDAVGVAVSGPRAATPFTAGDLFLISTRAAPAP
ncbi:MAG TPA: hypothetical protein VLT79_04040 [Gemmatimonadales bacterium]|nr:hypothetical protein [Gemmatimonadales bacterium]